MSVMSVRLSACELFWNIYLSIPFWTYSIYMGNPFWGTLLYFPLPFLSCHSPWMVVKGVVGGMGFDLHARVRDMLR